MSGWEPAWRSGSPALSLVLLPSFWNSRAKAGAAEMPRPAARAARPTAIRALRRRSLLTFVPLLIISLPSVRA